jgi:hypothetical protein
MFFCLVMFAGSTFKEQRDASRARIEAKAVVIALESSDGIISLRVSDDGDWIRSNPVRIERDGIKYYALSRTNDRRSIGGPAELSLGHDSCLHY